MLPIVNATVKGEKFSIYNPAVQAKHPLNGLRLTNSTDLHLMQGPITVFDGGVYAGDALIEDIPPGSERLISYALDLDTEVAPESKGQPERLLSVRLAKGTLIIDRKYVAHRQSTRSRTPARRPRRCLIEYPLDPNWTLVSPKKPAEKTRDKYRFAVEAKPGEPAKLVVDEERTEPQMIALTNLDENTIGSIMSAQGRSDKVKAALADVVEQKQLRSGRGPEGSSSSSRSQIDEEQARIRENMAQLDRTTDLYKRYVKKLCDQEDEIEKLRGQIAAMADQETRLRKANDEFLIGLDVQ